MRYLSNKLSQTLLLLLAFVGTQASAAPKVLASIKPLQMIAAAITDGVSEPDVLLPAGASPHDFALRPSDLGQLSEADIILWSTAVLEPYLPKMLAALDASSINFDEAEPPTDTTQASAHHHEHDHEEDLHQWLSPTESLHMARQLSDALSALDRDNAPRYAANLATLEQDLALQVSRDAKRLAEIKQPIYVFHDAYGPLEDAYGIEVAGSVSLSPEARPGTRHIVELREQLKASKGACLFSEPQYESSLLEQLTEGLDIKLAEIDPLGSSIELDGRAYLRFQASLVESVVECLQR